MANQHHPNQVAVVMVPLPAQGHLNQLLHLSRLISAATIPVHYIGSSTHLRQAKLRLHAWNPSSAPHMHFHELPTPPFDNPPPDPHAPTKFPAQLLPSFAASVHLRRPVRAFLSRISADYRRVVVVFDSFMSYVVQDADSVPNAECYCFRSIPAFTLCSFVWDAAGRPDLPAEAEALKGVPGPEVGLFPPEFTEFSRLQSGSRKFISGYIFNSSRIIEGFYLDLLAADFVKTEKIWALGPFNPAAEARNDVESPIRHKSLTWLDTQQPNSVIFVSFGTTSSLSDAQIQALAIGLERSSHKFVWVVRDADRGDIFAGGSREAELPPGFEDRTAERGVVVRDWAPQLEILGHSSTGGFMSHCGWNSCVESISMGVPMAAWPMHTDQPGNAVLVTEVLGVGLRVVDWGCRKEVVAAEGVEGAVRRLMESEEGERLRRRAGELGAAVRDSVGEGGVSWEEMSEFIAHITR